MLQDRDTAGDRGTVKVDEAVEPSPDDEIVIIEAFDESERLRAHELMTESWELLSVVRRRTADGAHYTEYRLRAPRPSYPGP